MVYKAISSPCIANKVIAMLPKLSAVNIVSIVSSSRIAFPVLAPNVELLYAGIDTMLLSIK